MSLSIKDIAKLFICNDYYKGPKKKGVKTTFKLGEIKRIKTNFTIILDIILSNILQKREHTQNIGRNTKSKTNKNKKTKLKSF